MNHQKRERLVLRANRGITKTRLSIVVAIVGIIAAFAYPSYRDSVRKSKRAEGKTLLMDAAERQKRFFFNFNTYTNVIVAPGGCMGAGCGLVYTSNTSENGLYQLSAPAVDATSYTLQVTALGGQADDAQCATMSLNSVGEKTPASADCW